MRGGSRWGAGRPAQKGRIGSLLFIDIQQFVSRGLLVRGNYFSWSWNLGEELSGSMSVRVNSLSQISLEYNQQDDGESKIVSYQVYIERTPCNFGGSRPWLICPHSGRRVKKLYYLRGGWYARECLRVGYASQSEDVVARMWRRKHKIESKLSEELIKPKGMRWGTYKRLISKWNEAEERLDTACFQNLSGLMGFI
jgi:hypothetical protein